MPLQFFRQHNVSVFPFYAFFQQADDCKPSVFYIPAVKKSLKAVLSATLTVSERPFRKNRASLNIPETRLL